MSYYHKNSKSSKKAASDRKVLKKLEEKDFKINIKKTKITVLKIEFLSVIINCKEIYIDSNKIKVIKV
jgi:hypothetical protein